MGGVGTLGGAGTAEVTGGTALVTLATVLCTWVTSEGDGDGPDPELDPPP